METDTQKPPKRLNQIRLELRAPHYSLRTDRVQRNNVLAGASALGGCQSTGREATHEKRPAGTEWLNSLYS
jgi:hypothetical protein